jgi:hypothetical protein
MPTYECIFEKRAKGELQGREFLKNTIHSNGGFTT